MKLFICLRYFQPNVLIFHSQFRAKVCDVAADGGALMGASVTGGDITLVSVRRKHVLLFCVFYIFLAFGVLGGFGQAD